MTPQRLQTGDRPTSAWYNRMAEAIEAVGPIGGVTRTPHGVLGRRRRRLAVAAAGLATDFVWVGGKRLAVPGNADRKRYLKVYLNGVTPPEWVDDMPETNDADSEVFDTARHHIHLPGEYA